jgi:beta-glucosidase
MATEKKLQFHFPKKFLWGASVSTHQVEGGNHNQWTVWELETAQVKAAQAPYNYKHLAMWDELKSEATKPETYVSGHACDHYNRYSHDFDIAKALHFNTLRTGIEWSRIEPEEGKFNAKAIDHYKKYFAELKNRGITPVITLWHWTMPVWFTDKGGFEKRRNLKYFYRYVNFITEGLGEYFQYVITINEPTVYTTQGYYSRIWPPEYRSPFLTVWVLLNLAKAHRKSYKIVKRQLPKAQVGLAHNCTYFYEGDESFITKVCVRAAHYFGNEWFINRVKRQQDFLGLNFYFCNRLKGYKVNNPNERLNDTGWDMQPQLLGNLITQLYEKYKQPVLVTESGVADKHDQHRKWWIGESIKSMDRAIKGGVKMLGYIHWSLLDNFEWEKGFWARFGLVEVNFKTQQRKVRPSAQWYSRFINSLK